MKVRLISAGVALLILIPLLWIGKIPFAIGIGIISVLAYKEILDLKKSHNEIPDVVKIFGYESVIIGLIAWIISIIGWFVVCGVLNNSLFFFVKLSLLTPSLEHK